MISTTGHSVNRENPCRRAFTLPEMLIALSISSVVLLGTTSSLSFILKSTLGTAFYVEMNSQTRRGLEVFGRDMRMAKQVYFADEGEIEIGVPGESGERRIHYLYKDSDRSFVRIEAGWEYTVLDDLETLTLRYYNVLANPTSVVEEVKQIQLEAIAENKVLHLKHTNHTLSARYMMRNREVST